jgi:hypothetical protein
MCGSHQYANGVSAIFRNLDLDRRLTSGRSPPSGLTDETFPNEISHDVRDGLWSKAGRPSKFRFGQHRVDAKSMQNGAAIMLPQARGARACRFDSV